jgi:2,4-dienoyl-CoA reductase (NADPH2)
MLDPLASPIRIGELTAKNRLGQAPMRTNLGDRWGQVSPRMVDFYERRAQGGVGTIIVEPATVTSVGTGFSPLAGLTAGPDAHMPGLADLAEAIKRHDVIAVLQLIHPGKPVDNLRPPGTVDPDLAEVPRRLADAARKAIRAGFDGVEFDLARGNLFRQLVPPGSDRASNGENPGLDQGLLILREILRGLRSALGPMKLVGVRFYANDFMESSGLGIQDAIEIAIAARVEGIDYLSLTTGVDDADRMIVSSTYFPGSTLAELARRVRAAAHVPLFVAGSIADPNLAAALLEDGAADVILLGRGLLADSDLPGKWLGDDAGSVRPCVRCNEGCIGRVVDEKTISCSVNPVVGREAEWDVRQPAPTASKTVLVVGGGPAGLESARIAAVRGHKVTLCDRGSELGGHMRRIASSGTIAELRKLVDWYEGQFARLGVSVSRNTEVGEAFVSALGPDCVVVAVGADTDAEDIDGSALAILASDLRRVATIEGPDPIVAGGGWLGCEIGLRLAESGQNVTLLESLPHVATGLYPASRTALLMRLAAERVTIYTETTLVRVGPHAAIAVDRAGVERELPGSTVILATGSRPRAALGDELRREGTVCYEVGDCKRPAGLIGAVHSAFHCARHL